MKTQKQKIKAHLMKGWAISSWDAFEVYGITRLAAIIFMLREEGMNIVSIRREKLDKEGKQIKWWTEYRLAA